MKKELGLLGLGRMGMNMVKRLLEDHHKISVYNRTYQKCQEVSVLGAQPFQKIEDLVSNLPSPRVCWQMLPAGIVTEEIFSTLVGLLNQGDILLEGGNSRYQDSQRRAKICQEKGIRFLDVGVSGGIWGLEIGYCLMIGGDSSAYEELIPVFKSLAPPEGFSYMGPAGSGHYVKMIHNGIEYGMMEAYAEGFELLKAKEEFDLPLQEIARLWNQGSVVRSWLLELLERQVLNETSLSKIKGYVEDSGEGRWTVETALDLKVPAEVITTSLMKRFSSRQEDSFAAKVLAGLRYAFGGHTFKEDK